MLGDILLYLLFYICEDNSHFCQYPSSLSQTFSQILNNLLHIPFWMVVRDLSPSTSKIQPFYSPQPVLDFLFILILESPNL